MWLLLLAASMMIWSAPAAEPPAGARVATGSIQGAPYRIEIPADWNGDLVMLFHGYEVKGQPRADPWPRMDGHGIEQFLDRGYAVALSGYSAQGWAVEQAMADAARLRAHFEAAHGAPERTYAVGFSMGGHLTLAALEQRPAAFDGGLSLCGANMPATTVFQFALDALAGFDALFPGVLALGPGGLSDPSSPAMLDGERVAAALAADPEKAGWLARSVGVEPGDLAGTLWLYYAVLREMIERAGGFPADNRATVYRGFGDDSAFNHSVRRYSGDPEAIAYVRANANLTGRIEDPVVALSNAYDDVVANRHGGIYRALADEAGRSNLFVQLPPAGRGHCNFEPAQIGAAFDTLVGWVESGARP